MGEGAGDDDLTVPVSAAVSRWGDAARELAARVGGRWPADATRQVALCGFVHFRSGPEGDRWVVDDVLGFAAAAGARVAGGAIQPTLRLDTEGVPPRSVMPAHRPGPRVVRPP